MYRAGQIKSQETDSARKVLINLKRDIFNLRKKLLKIVGENRELWERMCMILSRTSIRQLMN